MTQERARVVELDFVRVVSMLSVILLHATSGYLFLETKASYFGLSVAFMINQGVRYCVPLFFLLSGLSLELSYRGQRYIDFIRKRLGKILLPYLFWTSLYYLDGLQEFSLRELVDAYLWGMAAPHLYFIIALLQLYILYLPLRRAMEKQPGFILAIVFFVSFFLQWGCYLMVFQVSFFPEEIRPYLLKTCFPWLFSFSLGIFLAKKRANWMSFVIRYQGLLFAACLFFLAFYVADSAATGSYDLSVKPILFVYVPLVFFTLYVLGTQAVKAVCFVSVIQGLARHSMTVFFCHIFILEYLRDHLVLSGTRGMLLLCAFTLGLALLFAFLFDNAGEKAKTILRSS